MAKLVKQYKGYKIKATTIYDEGDSLFIITKPSWSDYTPLWECDTLAECTEWIDSETQQITVYKLFRLKGKKLFPLFINRNEETRMGKWLEAECYPTKGFSVRTGWHCCYSPFAPHLKEILASGEVRVWVECTAIGYEEYNRPESQGGAWVLADMIKVKKILTDEEVINLRGGK